MKKTLKILVASLLMVMLIPFSIYANDSAEPTDSEVCLVELENGYYIIPFSPALPEDWTQEQWNIWYETLRILLEVHRCAQGLVAVAEVTITNIAAGTIEDLGLTPEELIVLNSLLSTLIEEFNTLLADKGDFLAGFTNELSRIAAFNIVMDFEASHALLQGFHTEFLDLNSRFREALGLGATSCGEEDEYIPEPPKPEPPKPEPPKPPSLPQTGTGIVVTSVGAVGIALTVIGAISAYVKSKKK